MSKRRIGNRSQLRVNRRGKRQAVIVVGLVLALLAASAALARWSGLFAAGQKSGKTGVAVTTTSVVSSSPSKEYIYAGGRLIATEEPASGGGGGAPTISQLNPISGAQNSSISLTITGTNLAGATSVNFNPASGITVSNINSSATQVTANISIAATAGLGGRDVSVTVGSQTSNIKPFTVTSASSLPSIISLVPNPVPVNNTGFTLTVNGTGFVSGAQVYVNSSQRNTTFYSANLLTADLLGSDRSTAGVRAITVVNPDGGTSTPFTLTISSIPNPVPHIGGINPQSATAGGPTFNMTVTSDNGSFVNGSSVRYDGSPRFTTYVNANTLIAQIFATDITTAKIGTHYITVFTSSPGGGTSNQYPFTVGSAGASGTGLRGQYFNNMTLCGTPVVTRTDATVDFWTAGSPATGINPDQFSIRWTGQVQPQFSETYTFYVRCDDGVRLWVNNQLLIDKWFDQYIPEWSNTITLAANQKYDIRMDYYEDGAGAEAHLSWSSLSTPKQIIATSRLYPPTGTPVIYEGMVEQADCATISGWALDRSSPNTAINVGIYDGTTLLATIPANQSRPDLIRCPGENGLHGFSWLVPQSLKNGAAHAIHVKYASTIYELGGSPKTLTCSGVTPPPAASSLNAVAVSGSQIDLQWQYAGSTQNGFVIQRNVDSAGYTDYATITNTGARTFSDINLPAGHNYCYKVLAYNSAGRSAEPNPTACQMLSSGGSGIPATPSNLTAAYTSSPRQVTLHWSDNSYNETSFQLRRRYHSATGNWSIYVTIANLPANTTGYIDTSGLANGYTYGYVVRAFNADPGGGASDFSNEAPVTIPAGQAPICAAVSTISGSGGTASYGYVEGTGTAAKWGAPSAGATGVDPVSGLNALYITDVDNQTIRMVYLDGPATGSSLLIAGSGQAGYFDSDDAYEARFNNPQGLAVIKNADGVVQAILVADTDNNVIRRILPPLGGSRWRVTTFSGSGTYGLVNGDAQSSQYGSPMGIAVGPNGSIYVADFNNAAIRLLNSEGFSTTWYSESIRFATFAPAGLAINEITGDIYVADQYASRICSVTNGTLVTLAGGSSVGYNNAEGQNAAFDTPQYLAWADSGGNGNLYIADANNNAIRVLDLNSHYAVTTWAGSPTAGYLDGANCGSALFNLPSGVAIGAGGELYVIDRSNNSVRKVQ